MKRQLAFIYFRIREHESGRAVERELPGATAVATQVLGRMLGSPEEEQERVRKAILPELPSVAN